MMNLANLLALALATTTAWADNPLRRQAATTTSSSSNPRIVGGTAASPGQYPFFVNWKGCGASLIYPDVILSAAHCNSVSSNTVYIGNTRYLTTSGGGSARTIVKRVPHPNFNSRSLANDFLVMKLSSNATQTPIPMNPDFNYPVTDQTLTVIGFGTLYNGVSSMSQTLQQVDLNAVSHSVCSSAYPGQINQNVMLCAGVPGGGKDSCNGDSGGPIFDKSGLLVGVVSWGKQCALNGYPGIYSRVSGGYSWINQQICQLSSYPPSWCNGGGPSPTPAPVQPTPAPVQQTSACRDSSTTFNVDDVVGNQGCSWLSINLSRFGYLCKFIDVAKACQLTCNMCGIFTSRSI